MTAVRYLSMAERTGYGLSALAYVDGLAGANVQIRWDPLVWGERGITLCRHLADPLRILQRTLGEDTARRFRPYLEYDDGYNNLVLHTVPEHWPRFMEAGKRNLAYTTWETDQLPSHWPALASFVDRLLVPSSFNKEVFEASGVRRPVFVVPHIFNPPLNVTSSAVAALRSRYRIPIDSYVFYSIGAWNPRKAVWTTLRAYLRSFTAHDDVTLVIKTDYLGPCHERDTELHRVQELATRLISEYRDPPRVCVIDQALDDDEIEALHRIGDCYISLSHGEGWGLGAFEAAGRGKPVIVTGWSGHLDYLPKDDAYLVDFDLVPTIHALGAASYSPDQRWAQADLDDATEKLRYIRTHPGEAAAKGERLKRGITEKFNQERIARLFIGALNA